jgi:hypothetical protein
LVGRSLCHVGSTLSGRLFGRAASILTSEIPGSEIYYLS